MTSESGFVETWSEKLEGAVAKNILHNSVMKNINLATNFGSTVVGKQLETVATLIRANTETFQDDITAYFVNLGGLDSHGDNTQFATRMIDVDNGLQKSKAEMEAQGQWDNVIIVQASEFGRSLTSNGKGTDHGWGGNYLLAGGSIRGGQILGEYPKDMTKNGKDMLSRGRVLPSTSWESVWNAIGQFMGVDDFEMNSVLPLRDNFDNLFDLEDVFDVIREPSPTPSSSPVASPIVSQTYVSIIYSHSIRTALYLQSFLTSKNNFKCIGIIEISHSEFHHALNTVLLVIHSIYQLLSNLTNCTVHLLPYSHFQPHNLPRFTR